MSETPAEIIARQISDIVGDPSEWTLYRPDADIVIAALAAAGYKILPREPTEAMVKAGALVSPYATPETCFRALWDAAP